MTSRFFARLALLAILVAPTLAAPAAAEWIPNGVPLSVAPRCQSQPIGAPDGAGGVIYAWDAGCSFATIDLYAQRIDANGERQWGPNGVPVCQAASSQSVTSIVSDGQGGAIVFWVDFRSGSSRLYAQRLDPGGVARWTADGVALTNTSTQSLPRAVADGAGGSIVAFMHNSGDIQAQRVDPGGAMPWGINGVAVCTATDIQRFPEITTDGLGGAIITWEDFRPAILNDIYAQRLSPLGAPLWAANGVVICGADSAQSIPAIASDGAGGAFIAWEEERHGGDDIYAQRINGNGISQWTVNGVPVCLTPGDQQAPRVAPDPAGNMLVAWRDPGRGERLHAQRLAANGTPLWTANGIQVASSQVFTSTPYRMCSDGGGGAILTWNRSSPGGDLMVQRLSSSGTQLWSSSGIQVCAATNEEPVEAYVLLPDGSGGAFIGWDDQRTGEPADSTEVYATRVDASGVLGPLPLPGWEQDGSPVVTEDGVQQNPVVTGNARGGAILAWEDYRPAIVPTGAASQTPRHAPLGPGRARIFAVSLDEYGVIDPGWLDDGMLLTTSEGSQTQPEIAPDDSGGAIVAWVDDQSGNLDLYGQRVTSTGAIAPGWSTAGQPVCVAPGDQLHPVVIEDVEGGSFVFWEDHRSGTSYDIYAVRITRAGTVASGWPVNGVAVCVAAGDQLGPAAVPDGLGGAIVTWSDARGASLDVYAQRIQTSGAIAAGWTANGVVLCTASGDQKDVVIAADGAGGAIVAWGDARSDSSDVFAQRALASGTVAWAANGVSVASVAGVQALPSMVEDGVGGVIIAWQDGRPNGGNGYDLYAQRIGGNGVASAGWPSNGATLCAVTGDQARVRLVADGHGGGIATWQDGRSGIDDIYVVQITADGTIDPRYPANGVVLCASTGSQTSPGIVSDGSGGAIVGWTDGRVADTDVYAMHVFGPSTQSVTPVIDRPPAGGVVLHAPWPNPARDAVTLSFELPRRGSVALEVVDVAGRRVMRWTESERSAGRGTVVWNGRDRDGTPAAPGLYLARLAAGGAVVSRRFVLLR